MVTGRHGTNGQERMDQDEAVRNKMAPVLHPCSCVPIPLICTDCRYSDPWPPFLSNDAADERTRTVAFRQLILPLFFLFEKRE